MVLFFLLLQVMALGWYLLVLPLYESSSLALAVAVAVVLVLEVERARTRYSDLLRSTAVTAVVHLQLSVALQLVDQGALAVVQLVEFQLRISFVV